MTSDLFLMLVVAVLVIGAAATYFRAGRDIRDEESNSYLEGEFRWMPAELRQAKLSQSEKQSHVVLGGDRVPVRPDQVYRTPGGLLIPVETKTRRGTAVYLYDIIELSLQRLSLVQARGTGNAAEHGYVRIKDREGNRRPTYKRVDLWPEEHLTALYHRYLGILSGEVAPTSQTNPNACSGCAYRSTCPKAL